MFERYTEGARRVIFFARYEASQYGSPYIETEHLLLGLLRQGDYLELTIRESRTEFVVEKVTYKYVSMVNAGVQQDRLDRIEIVVKVTEKGHG